MRNIVTIVTTFVVAAAGLLAQGRPAVAQVTGLIPLRAKIGVLMPRSSAKDFAGSTHLNGEVDVRIPHLGAGETFLTAGYSEGSRNGRKLRMIPVTLTRLFGPPNPLAGATGNVYFGAGAGPYFVRARGGGVSDSATKLGGFGLLGYQFPNKFFVEAKYHLVSGKVAGVRPNGLALLVGRSF